MGLQWLREEMRERERGRQSDMREREVEGESQHWISTNGPYGLHLPAHKA